MGAVFDIFDSGNQYRVARATWEGNNKVREANNQKEVKLAALRNFQVAESNKRRITAAGEEYNRMQSQLSATLNQTTTTKLNTQLAAANLQGSLDAQAAAMGVGGSSVDLISDLTKLQSSIQLQANEDEKQALSRFGSEDAFKVLDGAWQSIDNSVHFANLDYSQQIEPTKMKNGLGALVGTALATYKFGPQVGSAVANVAMSSYRAQQGDRAGARQYMDRGVTDAVMGMKEWASYQDGSGKSSNWFDKVRSRNQQSKAPKENWGWGF